MHVVDTLLVLVLVRAIIIIIVVVLCDRTLIEISSDYLLILVNVYSHWLNKQLKYSMSADGSVFVLNIYYLLCIICIKVCFIFFFFFWSRLNFFLWNMKVTAVIIQNLLRMSDKEWLIINNYYRFFLSWLKIEVAGGWWKIELFVFGFICGNKVKGKKWKFKS